MVAPVNGAPTPPAQHEAMSDGADNKRKREDEHNHAAEQPMSSRSAQTQRDILQILEPHDTDPSFLKHVVEHTSTDERSPKKARLSEPAKSSTTISSKLANAVYSSLEDLQKDAVHVSESLILLVRVRAKDREGQNAGRLLVDDLKQMQRTQMFEQLVKDVVEQERKYEAVHGNAEVKSEHENDGLPNGHLPGTESDATSRNGTVLTLFGNAPTPKQLFSSTQMSLTQQSDHVVKAELAIEEMSLPNGLTATKIMPLPANDTKKGPTFEEAFPPPYNLTALHPPKSHKRSTTRDTVITWEFKDQVSRGSRKGGYTVQSLTAADWLGYGGVDSKEEPFSPREKRKQRDRALSSGESTQPPSSKASLQEALEKEEEALFRRAYSSFAPSCDNSKALVPEETKSMVWWHKVGGKRYDETFALDPALVDERTALMPELLPLAENTSTETEDFGQVVEDLEQLDDDLLDAKPARDKTDIDEVLREISELLETLASHQRIRNAALPSSTSASRTPISPAPTLASRIGRPDSPAEDEMSTYYSLRRELAYLILRLPPYAVAKLNGNQLAELGVGKLITFDSKDTKGTMEEDQVSRLAKYTAMATAAGIATLTRHGPNASQHYSSTNQRTPAIGQAANTRYGQSGQFSAARTPISQPQFHRSVSNQSTYGTPSATAPRPGYGQPNQYSRPGAPQPGYGQANGQQHYQRPQGPSSYGSYGQQYNLFPPQGQSRPTYPTSQALAQFQQRSQAQAAAQNAVSYQSNVQGGQQQAQSPFNRNISPLKPAGYPLPAQASEPPQQPGSGRATPAGYPSQPQTPVNGFPGQRPVAPRAASGTPQPPPAQAQAPPPQPTEPVQANGHAADENLSAILCALDSANSPLPNPGQRDWQCPHCDKSFMRQSNLTVHSRTHTGERPFACPYPECSPNFAVKTNLSRHVVNAHKGGSWGGVEENRNREEGGSEI